jgi:hypothetical protein
MVKFSASEHEIFEDCSAENSSTKTSHSFLRAIQALHLVFDFPEIAEFHIRATVPEIVYPSEAGKPS